MYVFLDTSEIDTIQKLTSVVHCIKCPHDLPDMYTYSEARLVAVASFPLRLTERISEAGIRKFTEIILFLNFVVPRRKCFRSF